MARKVAEFIDDVNHEMEPTPAAIPMAVPAELDVVPKKGDFVAAVYEGVWYVGKVLKVDESDGDAKISFMKKARVSTSVEKFKWPQPPDKIWVKFNQILCNVNEPEPVGKSGREFKLGEDDHELICQIFQMK
ncbi:hypothetical protein DPMN_142540 [Dreissena polymorpha]|uniref:Uncharacterized protein n=1 Tax=Dreissena polymorpha TaxID=45954 RepID=A0A9D4HU80_DREPO|nr:hypothetical protein DPMN_057239 [Dreissena polymorpha]KAH3814062.1 hypothetical protein DPMN_142540 [Dreissena polymorpha]